MLGDLKVGDALYIGKDERWIKIKKVGRVYYELDHYRRNKVRKLDLKYEDPKYSGASFESYRTIEEFENIISLSRKRQEIGRFFTWGWSLPQEDVEAIYELITTNHDQKKKGH